MKRSLTIDEWFFGLLLAAAVAIIFTGLGSSAQMTTLLLRGELVPGLVVDQHSETIHTRHGPIQILKPVVRFDGGTEKVMDHHSDYTVGEPCKVLINRTSKVAAHVGTSGAWHDRLKACGAGLFLGLFPFQVLLAGLWFQWKSFRKHYRSKWRKLRKIKWDRKRLWVQAKALDGLMFAAASILLWVAACVTVMLAVWELKSDSDFQTSLVSSIILVLAFVPVPSLALRLKKFVKGREFKLWLPFLELALGLLLLQKLVNLFLSHKKGDTLFKSAFDAVVKMTGQMLGVDLP